MEVRDERSGVARRVGTPCRGIVLAHPLEEQAWATLPVEDGALVRAIVRPVVGNADLGGERRNSPMTGSSVNPCTVRPSV